MAPRVKPPRAELASSPAARDRGAQAFLLLETPQPGCPSTPQAVVETISKAKLELPEQLLELLGVKGPVVPPANPPGNPPIRFTPLAR
jgi:hypothetical protein